MKQASEELKKSESLPDKLRDAASEQTKTSTQEKRSTDKSESVVDGNISNSVKDRLSGTSDRLAGTSDGGLNRTTSTDISSSVSNWRRKREEREEENRKMEENSRKDNVSCWVKIKFILAKNEPPHGKTSNLHRRKQRRRSASW